MCKINDTMRCPLSGLGHVYLQLQLCPLKRLCPAAHLLAAESSHREICQLIQGLVTPTMWVLMSRCKMHGGGADAFAEGWKGHILTASGPLHDCAWVSVCACQTS